MNISLFDRNQVFHLCRFKADVFLNKSMENRCSNNIVWFDGEMTGLDADKHTLIEAAVIVTDGQLNILAEGPNIIIKHPDEVLDNMEEWPKNHHAMSGLTESCKKSKITLEQADQILYDFIDPFTIKGKCALAGNSIYMDRIFIRKYLPKFENQLSYRLIDVSTLKELLKRWDPKFIDMAPKKTMKHRALDDIRESLNELSFYKKYLKL
ncbi:oligoribonuclease, mitochondrial isoform X2 [Daktulosphaira vitifoliae]|uniref:oligoribonuclease, mitochondrial isoform X2 n=1 Tax=Daktulosphaira vitifoliae TaxID=58002 RepID=UPI0021AA07BB|nr:oligoribonuclease, mitochondrial isoform X2 [Daktulosphaira vitifoliae]